MKLHAKYRPTKFNIYSISELSNDFPIVAVDTKGSAYLGSAYLIVNSDQSLTAKTVNGVNIVYPTNALFVKDNGNNEEIQSVVFGASNYI